MVSDNATAPSVLLYHTVLEKYVIMPCTTGDSVCVGRPITFSFVLCMQMIDGGQFTREGKGIVIINWNYLNGKGIQF